MMATEAVRVRPLSSEDFDAWQSLWRGYLSFYRAEFSEELSVLTFRRLRGGEDMVGLIAVDGDERPIGLAHLVFHPTTWSPFPFCYLEDLFVARERRGGGVARALLAAVTEYARERGAGRIYWTTQQFNAPARSLYDTVGRLTSFVIYEKPLGT